MCHFADGQVRLQQRPATELQRPVAGVPGCPRSQGCPASDFSESFVPRSTSLQRAKDFLPGPRSAIFPLVDRDFSASFRSQHVCSQLFEWGCPRPPWPACGYMDESSDPEFSGGVEVKERVVP